MKTWMMLTMASLFVALVLAVPSWSADVAQGKCLTYDEANKTITIEEYDINISKEHPYGRSTGKNIVFNAATALIGIPPAPGDVLRISYRQDTNEKVAFKIMNVSKQDVMKE